jgi:hypothetical protein
MDSSGACIKDRRPVSRGFARPRWNSLQSEDTTGWKVTVAHRLRLLGIGEIKLNYYRPIAGIPIAIW